MWGLQRESSSMYKRTTSSRDYNPMIDVEDSLGMNMHQNLETILCVFFLSFHYDL